MLRISRLTDYGTVILVYLAQQGEQRRSASEVAAGTRVALPTAQKLLKVLARAGLVTATRGSEGGYALARPATTITAVEIVDALEGPVAITECSVDANLCELESMCTTGGAWQRINQAIRDALADVTLAELDCPPPAATRAATELAADLTDQRTS